MCLQKEESLVKSPKSDDTPLKIPRKRPSRKSRLSITERPKSPVMPSFLSPRYNAPSHQRAVSEPVLHSAREQSLDPDHLPLPGRYDSQNSNLDVENDSETGQSPPLIITNQDEGDSDSDGSTARELLEDDVEIDKESDQVSDGGCSVSQEPLTKRKAGQKARSFVPYICVKGHPKDREVKGTRANNAAIRKLILKDHKENMKLGWVYVAESKRHGAKKLKIGKTDDLPDLRIEQQQCGFELREVCDLHPNPFLYYSFLERVVHLELRDQRLKLICSYSGHKPHKPNEWFDIERNKAFEVLTLWRNWLLIQKPFDSSGKLTPYWKWKAEELKGSIADVDWQAWTQPHAWRYFEFLVKPHVKAHFASTRKDIAFYATSALVTLLAFMGHGGRGAIWATIFLLLL